MAFGPFHTESVPRLPAQESLEARLARIESKLDSIGAQNVVSLDGLLGNQTLSADTQSSDHPQLSAGSLAPLTPESLNDQNTLAIPPLQEILPTIDSYFRDFNCVMPLFHQASFMRLLHEFYSKVERRSKVSWGIINSVLALGSRMLAIEAGPGRRALSR